MNWIGLAGFGLVVLSAILMAGLAFLRRKSTPVFREIPAFARLRKAIGLAVEEGSRLHISLGRGGLTTPQSAAHLVWVRDGTGRSTLPLSVACEALTTDGAKSTPGGLRQG